MSGVRSSYDIVLAGRGGQGVIFLSRIMGEAALVQGLGVRTTETHGMAMRGGSVECFVRLGEGLGPLFRSGAASLIMVLHPGESAAARGSLAAEGSVLVNAPESFPLGDLEGVENLFRMDADAVARRAGSIRSANLALLGGAVAGVAGFPLGAESVEAAIERTGSKNATRVNLEVFRQGLALAGKG